jgi:Concanavalin A-like lectin/glucanases superfamily/SPRY domain
MFASKDFFLGTTAPSAYSINNSLRFRASASAYLNRTFATPTSSTIYTWSGWVKRGTLGSTAYLLGASTNTNFGFNSSNNIVLTLAGTTAVTTSAVYRDPSAWYHIIYTQNGSAQTIYVNGISAGTGTTSNTVFNTAISHQISAANTTNYFDGYLAEVNFVDGQALTPSSFGKTDANGVWQPIKYIGTYGNNGFYLKFADNSGATATTIGKDSSGNGNNWTPNNISVTAGTTYDSMIDSPTNAASGTQPVGNYCVISPIDENFTTSNAVVSDGNLKFALSSNPANQQACRGTQAGVTKFYFEVVTLSVGAGLAFGVKTTGAQLTSSGGLQAAAAWEIIGSNGNKWNGSSVAYGSAYTTNDIGMCAVDPVNGKIWFGKNGTWFASGDPVAGTNAAFTNVVSSIQPLFECGVSTDSIAANFGQRPFSYTPPSGYQALCTANLPTPTIANGAGYMAATTYTGTGATQSISNTVNSTSFQPDFVWIKSRSAATNNNLFDSIRTATNYLISNSTAANATNANSLTAFGSTGFTLGSDASSIGVNVNAATYVGWQWKGSGTTVSNTSGSITSTVCVNTTSGFSIATYTGTGANATVGHSLGVAPSMVIVKRRDTTGNWGTWHTSIANTNYLLLNSTAASASGTTYWNSTTPTSTVFSIGTSTDVNANTGTYVAYCFAPITGFSAFGSYTGNGSTDGPFVYLGFRPRWVMVKRTDSTSDWYIWDTSRDTYNVETNTLLADTAGAETSATSIDDLSNGFKCRSSTVVNASSGTYIYAAFAENPFNYSRAR